MGCCYGYMLEYVYVEWRLRVRALNRKTRRIRAQRAQNNVKFAYKFEMAMCARVCRDTISITCVPPPFRHSPSSSSLWVMGGSRVET